MPAQSKTYFSLQQKRMSSCSHWEYDRMTYFSGRDITAEDCCGREVPAGVRQAADG